MPLAAMIKGVEVEDVRPVISYLTTQVGKLNIKVRYISENDLRTSEVKNDKIKKN